MKGAFTRFDTPLTILTPELTIAADPKAPVMLREKIPPQRVDVRPERIAQIAIFPPLIFAFGER
jgi:hypothetical protein